MKKVDNFMHHLNEQVDQKFGPFELFFKKYFVIFSSTFLAFFLFLIIFRVFYNKPYYLVSVVKDDLTQINKILTDIDTDCNILSIKNKVNYIDFLNVEKFAGSAVGSLNLAYPEKWKGPYLRINPSLYGRFYELVRNKEGFFVLPGNGVRLPNGYVVGRDFDVTKSGVSILEMLKPGGYLNYKGTPLGLLIKFKIGDWDPFLKKNLTSDKIEKILDEYNAAFPYTKNDTKNENIEALKA